VRLAGAFAIVCLVAGGCGPTIFVPPSGPGTPAPEAAEAWTEATGRCRGVKTYAASLHLAGRVGDERIPSAGATVAIAAGTGIRLQIVAIGRPRFTLAGTADRSTFLLHDDQRVVTGRADEIVRTLVGAPIGPDRLLALLTGCTTRAFDIGHAERFGKRIAVTTSDGRVYLERLAGTWRSIAGEVDGLVVQYRRADSAFPSGLRIDSAPGRSPVTSLVVSGIDEIEVNTALRPELFAPPSAATSAKPMTLDELRAAGPLGRKDAIKHH
jgi:hypothetical protein